MNYLKNLLHKIDGKGYKAYKELKGSYTFHAYTLHIDYVQGDPFASPSKIRIVISRKRTIINHTMIEGKAHKIRCEDFIARAVARQINQQSKNIKGSGKSGLLTIDQPGQEVLERSAVTISGEEITICLSMGLPAQGRRILGKQAEQLFINILPQIINQSALSLHEEQLDKALQLCDQQEAIKQFLKENHLISFIANGSILPRKSGISNLGLDPSMAVPFKSPKELEVEIPIPHQHNPMKGMGIPKGITVIVGGGYHGKSTLLQAIERGVYDHIAGDGREYVVTDQHAYKIRAEDGRSIEGADISPFINNLPHQKDTKQFSSDNASGSTSQAANITEALEAGAMTLLIDEDTSATNFMIRDVKMQALVAREKEPITPFVDKVKQLYNEYDVSSIIVMGGSGDYFRLADQVIMMDQYIPHDVTNKAQEIAEHFDANPMDVEHDFGSIQSRVPLPASVDSRTGKKNKIKARGIHEIQIGKEAIHLQYVEQLVDSSQTSMIALIFDYLERENVLKNNLTIRQLIDHIENKMEKEGLASFSVSPNQHPGELARPRGLEFAAALNRLRTLTCK